MSTVKQETSEEVEKEEEEREDGREEEEEGGGKKKSKKKKKKKELQTESEVRHIRPGLIPPPHPTTCGLISLPHYIIHNT